MKKILITSLVFSSLFLSACQNTSIKPAPGDQKSEKASTSTQVTLNIKDNPAEANPQNTTVEEDGLKVEGLVNTSNLVKTEKSAQVLPNIKGVIVSETGFNPSSLELSKGTKLIINSQAKTKMSFYTTVDGQNACPILGSTFDLDSNQSQDFVLDQTMDCTVMNQQNPDQKLTLTVK